ncbi:hemerythrin [Orenia metallireducens]|uniref:Hemerythrin n=1 Tax=Orenia metallireducens TaxID=1413210 RepID=A0A285F303_9FIRM|nr:bacteriohemerythrin [Orenia metallireducens]PRX34804.1 hemerythrin [Orenia metallireducens]SNY05689.1 hemerythrin [Orenia metallireducens]
MFIKWADDFNIGIELIDRQHQEIFRQTNNFLKKLEKNKDNREKSTETVEHLFYFLSDYFVTHFNDEEELQLKYKYPKYERHKEIHQNFIRKINKIKYEFFDEEESIDELVEIITDKIMEWLINHIAEEDTKISEYIKTHDIK